MTGRDGAFLTVKDLGERWYRSPRGSTTNGTQVGQADSRLAAIDSVIAGLQALGMWPEGFEAEPLHPKDASLDDDVARLAGARR